MLHVCVERFDVMGVRGNILGWDGEVNKAFVAMVSKNRALKSSSFLQNRTGETKRGGSRL
jgi:hypothetical protein